MASNDEYQQRRSFEDKSVFEKNGWKTVTLENGNTVTYNEDYLTTLFYGTTEDLKQVTNKK